MSASIRYRYLELLGSAFIAVLIISNIIAVKIGDFGGLFLPVAVIVFPVSYILADVLTEVYGYSAMRRVIWTGFLCNLLVVAVIAIALKVPSAPFYQGQEAFSVVLGATPRILVASFIAYLVGSFSNSMILAKLKVKTAGRFLWLRTISSTVVGEALDSVLFITIAFYGVFPNEQIVTLIATQWAFKTVFEIIATPITYIVVGALKRAEKADHFDTATNLNPLAF